MFVFPGFSSKALFKPRLPLRGALRRVWASEFGCRGLFRGIFVSCGSFPHAPLPPKPPHTPGPSSEGAVHPSEHPQATSCTLVWQTSSSKAGSSELGTSQRPAGCSPPLPEGPACPFHVPSPFFEPERGHGFVLRPQAANSGLEKHPLRLPLLPQGNVWQSPTPATG